MSLGNFIDKEYLLRVSGLLDRFRQYQASKWNFRCPYCGDSEKNLSAAHAYVFPNKKNPSKLSFKCFKCGHSDSMSGMLKHIDESIYRDYIRSLFGKGGFSFSGPNYKEVPVKLESKHVIMTPDNFFEKVSTLGEDHPANVYLRSRQIPESEMRHIYYAEKFWETLKQLKPEQKIREGHDEPRIIFPIMDITNTFMVALQGRSLEPEAKLRYVDCQIVPDAARLYGQERINRLSTVIVVEGPIDSMFIENSVGLCGASKNPEGIPSDRVFYLDQEPRNPHIMARYKSLIEQGEKLVFLPDEFFDLDANDIAKIKGWSRSDFRDFILQHAKSGLKAKLKLAEWMKLCPQKERK